MFHMSNTPKMASELVVYVTLFQEMYNVREQKKMYMDTKRCHFRIHPAQKSNPKVFL